jgi:hypothetical protein
LCFFLMCISIPGLSVFCVVFVDSSWVVPITQSGHRVAKCIEACTGMGKCVFWAGAQCLVCTNDCV